MNNNFNKLDKKILDAAKQGDANTLLNSLNSNDRQKIEDTLADKDKLRQILNSEAAQNLLKILGGKQNGWYKPKTSRYTQQSKQP